MPIAQTITGVVMAFIFGIVVGSFLNVCIYRLPIGGSLTHPPSHCPRCQARLRPRDLVPLFSFLLLRGRCRYCKVKISWRYFTIEFITGLLFVAGWLSVALRYSSNTPLIWTTPGMLLVSALWVFSAAMLVTFMIDLDTTYVIEPVTWVAMAAGIFFELTAAAVTHHPVAFTFAGHTLPHLPAAVPGMAFGFLVFIAMDLFGRLIFRKPGMGLGDAYIGAAIGALLGPLSALLSFGIAVFLGACIGVALMSCSAIEAARKRRAAGKQQQGQGQEPEPAEVPEADLQIGPLLLVTVCVVALAIGQIALAGWLGRVLHGGLLLSLIVAAAQALVMAGALVIIGFLSAKAGEVPTEEELPLPAETEAPPAHYMPFGPFLTASALLIAMAPHWFMIKAKLVLQLWMGLYGK